MITVASVSNFGINPAAHQFQLDTFWFSSSPPKPKVRFESDIWDYRIMRLGLPFPTSESIGHAQINVMQLDTKTWSAPKLAGVVVLITTTSGYNVFG